MRAIVNGRILMPDGEIAGKALLFGERIAGLGDPAGADEVIDAGGWYVAPGLVDVHIHGYLGADASDGDADGLRRMAKGVLANGVTSFLPTTMTVSWDTLETVFGQIKGLMAESRSAGFDGAEILGCHAEGPFINPKRKGAQAGEHILPPDAEKILPYADVIRLLTLAPEMPGGEECVRVLKEKTDIVLSVGHTDADYDQAAAAARAGANHATHLFNAMPPLLHRAPGAVAALLEADAYCELIADTFHVDRRLFPLLRKIKGDKLTLITDCTRAGGMPDGEYTLGGQPIFVEGVACRLRDGTIAGSVLKLNDAVRNWRDYAHAPMYEAVRAASLTPAESVGLADKKGSLTPGHDADIILMDDDCRVSAAWVRGARKY